MAETRHRKKRGQRAARQDQPLVSVCLIGRDEERFLDRALTSVQDLADEIVYVDTGSCDHTIEIAKAHEARVYEIPWPNDFSAARNYGIDRARGRWIVVLDCDEEFPPEQGSKLRWDIEHAAADTAGMQIAQANVRAPDDHRLIDSGKTIRIFRNTPKHRYQGPIHEQIAHSLTDGRVWQSPYYVWHYGFLPDVVRDKAKVERNYSMLLAYLETLEPGSTLHSYVLSQIGRECQRMGRPEEADRYFREALVAVERTEADPAASHFPYFDALSVYHTENLLQLGRHADAEAFCLRRLERSPWLADLWFFLGYAELLQEKTAIGVTHVLWSTTVADVRRQEQEFYSPARSITAYQNAAVALTRLGAPEAALQVLTSACGDVPDDPGMVALVTDLLERFPQIVALARTKLPKPMLLPVFKLLLSHKAYQTVLQYAELPLPAESPVERLWLASCALHAGNAVQAIDLLASMAVQDEVGAYAQLARVLAYKESGRLEELAHFLGEAPKDLFHSMQRDLAGLELGAVPQDYPAYRARLSPLIDFWQPTVPTAPQP